MGAKMYPEKMTLRIGHSGVRQAQRDTAEEYRHTTRRGDTVGRQALASDRGGDFLEILWNLVLINIAMSNGDVSARCLNVIVQAPGDGDRSVPAAGASNGNGQIGLAFLFV